MSKEKQIEEMAEIMSHSCEGECFTNKDGLTDCAVCEACLLYEAGYRKQSKGEWIVPKTEQAWNNGEYPIERTCSVCGMRRNIETQIAWNFCPNCGARMSGGQNEQCQ